MRGGSACLLGRDWLRIIPLDWHSIASIAAAPVDELKRLLQKFSRVFDDGTGTMHNFRAKLQVQEGAPPRFCRPRPVPFALKEGVEQELESFRVIGDFGGSVFKSMGSSHRGGSQKKWGFALVWGL